MNVEQNTGNTARLSPDEAAQRENDRIKWLAEAQAQAQQLVASNNEVAAWLGATPTAESIPPESPLPLNERARLGLLVGETELPLWEILRLEFPTKSSQQRGEYADWQEAIEAALCDGLLVSRPETRITHGETCLTGDWLIDRESYRQWRVTQPDLPAGSHIHKWLGATPGPEPAESIPPAETSLPELPGPARLTEAQQDKADCQAIAYALWAEQPGATQTDILKNSRIKPYLKKWPGKNTLPGWLSEIDPRPKEQRRGRPKAR